MKISVLGLCGKILGGWGRCYRGGFCEKLPEASPMSDRASATNSKMDSLLAEAKLISDSDSASVMITYLRGVKILCRNTARERSENL